MSEKEESCAPRQHAAADAPSLETAIQMHVQGTAYKESDRPAETTTVKKHRLDDGYISFILAMPIEKPEYLDTPSYLWQENMAEILGVTEDCLEQKRQLYKECVLRSQRIHDHYLKFQVRVRDEWLQKGYVEVDDDYFTVTATMWKEAMPMWEDPALTFKDSDYEKQARCFLDLSTTN
ncbi:hypothetical protein VPH35_056967 [Triticum aestivum]|uniref:Uncharacterized protein n=1 Tax=Triticum turgidum subsp. durum TaxID=4567 RepID=A0A9R1SAK3_TRITD|nr:unnamed protein product [Triticum turgidum subsp. durum]